MEILKEWKDASGTINTSQKELSIGLIKRDGLVHGFNGAIDEVRLYNRALSEAEIKRNMAAEGLAVVNSKKLSITWGKIRCDLD